MTRRYADGLVVQAMLSTIVDKGIQPVSVPDNDYVRAEMLGTRVPGLLSSVQACEYSGWVFVRTKDGNNFAWTVVADEPYPFTQEEEEDG